MENDTVIHLQDGPISRKISTWLDRQKKTKASLEIEDANFKPASSDLTAIGTRHVSQVAQILAGDHRLRAKIVYSMSSRADDQGNELEQLRAARLRDKLIALSPPPASGARKPPRVEIAQAKDSAAEPGLSIQIFRQ
ncbi:MAG: hypothetical protein ACJ8EY_02345 [Sphingomicrobium sp.]